MLEIELEFEFEFEVGSGVILEVWFGVGLWVTIL